MDLKAYLSELEYIVNIDSGADSPEGLREIAAFFEAKFKEMGWLVRSVELPANTGPLLVCCNREAPHYDVMLMGHLDTVFPKGTARQRPFRLVGGRAYGPGVFDMKQGSLLIYHLLKNMPSRITDKLNILAVFNPDEEIGSPYSEPYYAEYAKKCDRAFIYEGAGSEGARCVQRRGRLSFDLSFTGRDGHCGYVFTNGALSAISEMAKWIVALDGLQSEERGTTVNIGVVSGGTCANTVAKYAEMTVDIRFDSECEKLRADALLEKLKNEARARQIDVQTKNFSYTPPLLQTGRALEYIGRAERAAKAAGHPLLLRGRGGLSDANKLYRYGVACIDGMGPGGDFDHTAEEYLDVTSVGDAFELSLALLSDIAENNDF